MKSHFEEKPLTFGYVRAEITTLAREPYCREHRGEFGVWAAFLLVAGALVRCRRHFLWIINTRSS